MSIRVPSPGFTFTAKAPGKWLRGGRKSRDEELLAGPSRNFQVFDPLDFLAEVTQHVPDFGEHLIRYYGWYSNKTRGQTAKRQPPTVVGMLPGPRSPTAREARKGWAALIRQVYETDPLRCSRCGAQMKIVAFIERHQTDVIAKIPRSRGCGMDCGTTPPPAARRRSGWRSWQRFRPVSARLWP